MSDMSMFTLEGDYEDPSKEAPPKEDMSMFRHEGKYESAIAYQMRTSAEDRQKSDLDKMQQDIEERQFIKAQTYNLKPQKYDLDDFGLEFSLASKETIEEQIATLEDWELLPDNAKVYGVKTKDGENAVGFAIDDDFYIVNAIGQGTVEKVAASILNGEVTLGVAAAFSPQVKGASWVGRAIWEGLAASTGKGLDEVLEEATGKQRQTIDEIASDMTAAGMWGAGGATIGNLFEAGWNAAKLRGFKLGSDAPKGTEESYGRAIKAAMDEGIRAFHKPGSVVAKLEQMSEAMGKSGISTERRVAILDKLNGLHDQINLNPLATSAKDIYKYITNIKKGARFTTEESMRKGGFKMANAPKKVGGEAYQEGVDAYRLSSKETAGGLYDKWFDSAESGGVSYDLSPFLEQIDSVTKSPALMGEKVVVEDGASKIVDYSKPVRKQIDNDLKGIIDFSKDLKRIQEGDPREITEALKQLRTKLIDLAEKPLGQVNKNESQAAASRLLSSLHDVIDNPVSPTPGASEAFKKASEYWRNRSDILDALNIDKYKNDGEALFDSLTGSLTEKKAALIQRVLHKNEYDVFRASLATDLLNNPNNKKMNSRAYQKLLPKQVRDSISLFEKEMQGLDSGVLATALTKRQDATARIHGIVQSGSVKEIDEMVTTGLVSKADMQNYVFADLLDKVVDFNEASSQVSPKRFVQEIEKLKKGGFWKYLSSNQKKVVSNVETISSFLNSAGDAGVSLAVAEIVAQEGQVILHPLRAGSARMKAYQIQFLAWLGNTDTVVKALTGGNKSPKNITKFRAGLLGTMQAIHVFARDEEKGNLPDNLELRKNIKSNIRY